MTLLNVLSDVRMCEKYKIYYPYSIGPIVYTVMPELRGARGGPFPIFGRSFQPGGGRFCPIFTTGTPMVVPAFIVFSFYNWSGLAVYISMS